MRFASDDGEIRFGIPVGSIDPIDRSGEFGLNYDHRAIAALLLFCEFLLFPNIYNKYY